MARNLSDKGVAALKPRHAVYAHPDPLLPGHYIRVRPSGSKMFVAVTRDTRGKQVWTTIGTSTLMNIEEAREKARAVIKRIRAGEDKAGPQSFESVAHEWLKRHVEGKDLITAPAIRRNLANHVLPVWGGRDFASIKRSEVAALLDTIEDNAGPVAADKVLAHLSAMFAWFASRNDSYNPPIVRGMRRSKTKERARTRILTDNEIRTIWRKAEGAFGDLLRLLLLTGQRRDKVASMKWEDISVDGVWSIPNGHRKQKGTGGDLKLPKMALDIIRARPRLVSNPHVFPAARTSYFRLYATGKEAIDAATGISGWRLHDFRRTSRSLMARAGIASEVAEQVLGHSLAGVEGVYNRHRYTEEKAHALRSLADLIDSIINPRSKKVIRLSRKR